MTFKFSQLQGLLSARPAASGPNTTRESVCKSLGTGVGQTRAIGCGADSLTSLSLAEETVTNQLCYAVMLCESSEIMNGKYLA